MLRRSGAGSLPAEDLLDGGFIRSDGKGGYEYLGPDSGVLLSDAFLDTHCIGLTTSGRDPDAIGLTFEPLASSRGLRTSRGRYGWVPRTRVSVPSTSRTHGRPGSRPRSAVSDGAGRFTLDGVPAGTQEVAFRHPRLDSLTVLAPSQTVTVGGGTTAEVSLAVPSRASILGALCGAGEDAPGSSAVIGLVRGLGGGGPVVGATVALEWTDYRVAAGRDVLADVQTLQVTTDARGRYIACGVPPGVLLAAQALIAGESGAIRRAKVRREDIVVLDLDLEPVVLPSPPWRSTGALPRHLGSSSTATCAAVSS